MNKIATWEQICQSMTKSQLRECLDNCHKSKDFDYYFIVAAKIYHERFD